MARRQFITRNRRLAGLLAVAVVIIGVAAAEETGEWISPGVLILPILAGGLLLRPRALRILFCVVAVALAYDAWAEQNVGPGIVATIVVTALFADVLSRTRAKLGMQGLRGDQMLIELRDRIRVQSRLPALPDGWHSASVLAPAGGASFGGAPAGPPGAVVVAEAPVSPVAEAAPAAGFASPSKSLVACAATWAMFKVICCF